MLSFYQKLKFDLSNRIFQTFSLPNPTIKYIFEYAYMNGSMKLMECCKHFKLEQIRLRRCQMDNITLGRINQFYFGKYWFQTPTLFGFDTLKSNQIEIESKLTVHQIPRTRFYSMMPKFNLSRNKTLEVKLPRKITSEALSAILTPSLKRLTLELILNNAAENPALTAFKRCPKLSFLRVRTNIFMTKICFKEMLKCERKAKLSTCDLDPIKTIDAIDVRDFVHSNLTASGGLNLFTKTRKCFKQMNTALSALPKINENEELDCPGIMLSISGGNVWSRDSAYFSHI